MNSKKEFFFILTILILSLNLVSGIEYTDIICEPNERFCGDNSYEVLLCGEFGDEATVVETCQWNEACSFSFETNSIDCVPNQKVKNEFNKGLFLGFFISIVLVVLVVIILRILKKKKPLKD